MNNQSINVKKTTEYTKHGCNIKGNLLVFEYWHLLSGNFSAMDSSELIEQIKLYIAQNNIQGTIILTIPDFVFRKNL